MLRFAYLFTVLVSLFCLIIYFEQNRKSINKNYLVLFIACLVTAYGYTQEVFCTTLEGVISGHQIYYIGSVFTVLFILFALSSLCNFSIKKYVRWFLLAYALIICFFIITMVPLDLYYKDLSVYQYKDILCLKKTYGPLHNIFFIYLAILDIIGIYIVCVCIVKRKKTSIKTIVGIMSMIVFGSLCYVIPRIIHFPAEIIPFGYAIMDVFILLSAKHLSMYDMTENMVNVFDQRQEYGYISFDISKHFMGCNEFALLYFPELENIRIDAKINQKDGKLFSEILPWIERWQVNENEKYSIYTNEKNAICSLSYIKVGKKNIGYLIEMKDETETNKYVNFLNSYNHQLQNNVEEKSVKIQHIQDSIITGMASMVESRDNSTGGHIKRTSDSVKIFLEHLKKHTDFKWLSDKFIEDMIKAAPMHDLGKIAVNDAVLRKPSKFTPEEYEEMKKHPTEGAKIVLGVLKEVDDEDFKMIAVNVAHYHHEKWDGTGYPTGKSGENIPIEARIMALCDVFDALVTKRCYKEAFNYDEAFDIIKKDLGTHFDPSLGKVFLECREQLETMYTLDSLINNTIINN